MTRPTLFALTAALALLAGCGSRHAATADGAPDNMTAAEDNMSVEDVASDGLAAPADMPMDSESNSAGNQM